MIAVTSVVLTAEQRQKHTQQTSKAKTILSLDSIRDVAEGRMLAKLPL